MTTRAQLASDVSLRLARAMGEPTRQRLTRVPDRATMERRVLARQMLANLQIREARR